MTLSSKYQIIAFPSHFWKRPWFPNIELHKISSFTSIMVSLILNYLQYLDRYIKITLCSLLDYVVENKYSKNCGFEPKIILL